MRRVSLNARTAHDAVGSAEVEVVLIKIEHPDLDEPLRLSTDPTVRLSTVPLAYGTRSTWLTTDSKPFEFVLMGAILPSDQEDAPPAATITVEAVDEAIAATLIATSGMATVHMAVVLAGSPNQIESEWLDMRLVMADGDANEIRLSVSREPITEESCPAHRMTKQRFPGLHR